MITLHPEAVLLVPAVLSVTFLLWALWGLWKDERRHTIEHKTDRYRL